MPAKLDNFKMLLSALVLLFTTGFSIQVTAAQTKSALFVAAESVLQEIKAEQKILLIDIRESKAFEKVRIPGSINIPLSFIKTKPFLKPGPLVLVSAGYGQRFMEKECRRLNARGFKAVILLGGLCAWKQAGGKLEGDLTALGQVGLATPWRFLMQPNPARQARHNRLRTTGDCLPCRRNQ